MIYCSDFSCNPQHRSTVLPWQTALGGHTVGHPSSPLLPALEPTALKRICSPRAPG